MNVTRKDLILIGAIVTTTVTAVVGGVSYVDSKLEQHALTTHPNTISREEFKTYMELILERLKRIESKIEG